MGKIAFLLIILVCLLGLVCGCECGEDGSSKGDDDDNADNDDDDSGDDDQTDDDSSVDDDDVLIESAVYIAGGTFSGAALTMDDSGNFTVVSSKSRQLRVYQQASDWDFTLAGFGVYANVSVATGPDGSLHLAYYDWYGAYLWYATNASGSWKAEIVDGVGDVGHYSTIAVDADGFVHIAYNLEVSRESLALKYATNRQKAWDVKVVEDGSGIGAFPKIAVDESGRPYVTYNDTTNEAIHAARYNGSTWDIVNLPQAVGVGRSSDVAIDSNNNIHLAYRAYDGVTKLVYLSGGWGTMITQVVDATTTIGDSLSLAVDHSNLAHIAYYNSATGGTMYAHDDGSSWETIELGEGYPVQIVAGSASNVAISFGGIGAFVCDNDGWEQIYFDKGYIVADSAIAVDQNSNIHIVFIDENSQSLMYATDDGSGWVVETLRSAIGGQTEHADIAVDTAGIVHITFYNDMTKELGYITNAAGSWETESVDAQNSVGSQSSLALDSTGFAHISYYDATEGDLKYATNSSGSWMAYQVDSEGNVGAYSSLAVDESGTITIAYTDTSDSDINVAVGNDDSWNLQVADQAGGEFVSLALDGDGAAHLAFIGAGLRYLNNAKGFWFSRTIDGNGLAEQTALLIHDNRFCAAYQSIDWNLSYIAGQDIDWESQIVDDIGEVGSRVDMTLGPDGHRYISYVGEGALWLAVVE